MQDRRQQSRNRSSDDELDADSKSKKSPHRSSKPLRSSDVIAESIGGIGKGMTAIADALAFCKRQEVSQRGDQPNGDLLRTVVDRLDASQEAHLESMSMVLSTLKAMKEESSQVNLAILQELAKLNK
jgi:hypothetical protein